MLRQVKFKLLNFEVTLFEITEGIVIIAKILYNFGFAPSYDDERNVTENDEQKQAMFLFRPLKMGSNFVF